MKIDKDWLSYVLASIPALLAIGFTTLFRSQINWWLVIGILLMFVVIGRMHSRYHKLQSRVEELEERAGYLEDRPAQVIGEAIPTQRLIQSSPREN
jgi:hypothetical protein